MISLSLLVGLPALALLGLLGARQKWSPPFFWRLLSNVAAFLSVVYLIWVLWRVLTLP